MSSSSGPCISAISVFPTRVPATGRLSKVYNDANIHRAYLNLGLENWCPDSEFPIFLSLNLHPFCSVVNLSSVLSITAHSSVVTLSTAKHVAPLDGAMYGPQPKLCAVNCGNHQVFRHCRILLPTKHD
jgi:hypothetical protein